MKKTAAIYARVSSDRQKEEGTIASQRAALLAYAQANGLMVPPEWIFEDEGYSGAVLARPALERLRDLAAAGQIEMVLVHAPDRLSRKYAYQVLLIEELARHGVETRFVKSPSAQTPEEHLLLQFQGMIAEYERAQIAERTRRGIRHRAKEGLVNVLRRRLTGIVTSGKPSILRRILRWRRRRQQSCAKSLNSTPGTAGALRPSSVI